MGDHGRMSEDRTHVQEFFGARAADWDRKFPGDGPAFTTAVTEFDYGPGTACSTRAAAPGGP